MTEQHTPPPANPKADAKAAKAYAKATRPWYKKKRWLALIALVVIIAIAAASGGGSGDDDKTSDKGSSASTKDKANSNSGAESKDKPSAYGSAKLPLQNGDWRLDSIKVKDDGLGDFGGTARITYTGDDEDGGNNLFTITLFQGKEVVGTLQGSANTVKPGSAVTVQLISQDKYKGGKYKYDFQNDL